MPELIDLEVARENMLKRIKGRKLTNVKISVPKIIENTSAEEVPAFFEGKTVDDIERIAKILRFRFGDDSLVVHLMLHGDYCWSDSSKQHKHVVMELEWGDENPSILVNDWSSWVKVEVDVPEYQLYSSMLKRRYGPDPLKGEISEVVLLKTMTEHARIGIKKVLTDQTLIAGLGNAYVDEILWNAKLHPKTTCKRILDDSGVPVLCTSISEVLSKSLEIVRALSKGVAIDEQPRDFMKVYRKSGHACPRCGYMVACLKVNSRDTFVCEKCQP
jgi:formamidopyrimidine-DNA glycosylase